MGKEMKTKEQILQALSDKYDDEDSPHRRGGYRDGLVDGWKARESELSVAQAEGSDEEAAFGCFTGDCPHETQVECNKATFEHGRANERRHIEIKDLQDKLEIICGLVNPVAECALQYKDDLKHQGARSAKLVEALKHISMMPFIENARGLAKDTIADYERGK